MGETQQIGQASFHATTNYRNIYNRADRRARQYRSARWPTLRWH